MNMGRQMMAAHVTRVEEEIVAVEAARVAASYGPGAVAAAGRRAAARVAALEAWGGPIDVKNTVMLGPIAGLRAAGDPIEISPAMIAARLAYGALGAAAAGYHGYHRNRRSTGYAALWAIFGFAAPLLTGIVSVVEGYGKPAKGA